MDDYRKNIDENQIEESRVRNVNKELIKKYEDALMIANRNRLSVQQQGTETEDEYLKRLEAIENEKYDPNLYLPKAELRQVEKLKDNQMVLYFYQQEDY